VPGRAGAAAAAAAAVISIGYTIIRAVHNI